MSDRVLLVTVDSIRRDHQKYLEKTSDFLEFEERPVFATAASTYPSFPAILSGEFASEDGVESTVAEEFEDYSIGISTNHFLSPRYGFDSGFDYFSSPKQHSSANWKSKVGDMLDPGSRKHQIAVDIWSSLQKAWSKTPLYTASRDYRDVADVVHEFNEARKGVDEWFGWIHLMEPHHPYNPPDVDTPRHEAKSISRSVLSGEYTDEEAEETRELYKNEVKWVDKELSSLWKSLPDDTTVVFCADHGEYLGEDDQWGHGEDLVPELLQVPLAYRNVDRKPSGEVVSLIDVPTILTGEEYKNGRFERELAFATVNNEKAVFGPDSYINSSGTFNYNGEEVSSEELEQAYENFNARRPSRMTEGVEEDLEALGYL